MKLIAILTFLFILVPLLIAALVAHGDIPSPAPDREVDLTKEEDE